MEITGKIILVLPERGGVSASTGNEWRMGSYVLETLEQYPRKMCFDVFGGDKIEQFHLMVGELHTEYRLRPFWGISGRWAERYL